MRRYILSPHTLQRMRERNVSIELVERVLDKPEQIVPANNGRKAYQSWVRIAGVRLILRLIVKEGDPLVVVTLYATSDKKRYWRTDT